MRGAVESSRRFPPLRALLAALAAAALALTACRQVEEGDERARYVMMVGIDASGSFRAAGDYDDAVEFLAHYIYGHLHGLGDLRQPSSLFVGAVGGSRPGEAQAFHPIHDFEEKGVDQIAEDLRRWFPPQDQLTDFNAFFQRVAELAQRQGLVLAPMNIVIVSDGIPDVTGGTAAGATDEARFAGIDLSPLEYLSRSITVRILYPTPSVAAGWERSVERQRVRLWTTDREVMAGWRNQLDPDTALAAQEDIWRWVSDNVDFRVRQRIF